MQQLQGQLQRSVQDVTDLQALQRDAADGEHAVFGLLCTVVLHAATSSTHTVSSAVASQLQSTLLPSLAGSLLRMCCKCCARYIAVL